MAISDSFNLSNALNSQSYAYKCWYNYNYGNNTMGISAKDMGEITQTWNSQLNNWHATALDDENAYEIPDDDFSMAKNNGKSQAKEKTGYDGSKGGMKARAWSDLGLGAGAALGGSVSAVRNAFGNGASAAGKGIKSVFTKSPTPTPTPTPSPTKPAGGTQPKPAGSDNEVGAKQDNKKLGDIVTVVMASATAVRYWINKPNKEQKEACDALQDEMMNAQAALGEAQNDMSEAGEEVQALSDEAQMANEDANDDIEDKKSEYDMYKASYDALMEKVKSGESLTEDEKALLQELVPLMQELGLGIQETQEETTDVTGDIYDEMGTYQETYDNAAGTVAEVEGLTDYAESFDSTTRNMCYVEAAAQTLNGTGAGLAAARLFAGPWWNYAFGVMGVAAAGSSAYAATQQFQWAGDVGTEIHMRRDTQDLGSLTNDIYDESIDGYDGNMSIVEDLELEIPKDLEDMQETMEGLSEGAETALTTDVPEKEPEEKEELD